MIAPVIRKGPVTIELEQQNGVQALIVISRGLALRVPEDGVSLLSQPLTAAEDSVRSAQNISLRQLRRNYYAQRKPVDTRQGTLPTAIGQWLDPVAP